MDLLLIATKGPEHPTDASFPFFLARAAQESGRQAAIVLAADSSLLASRTIRENVQGVGLSSLEELYSHAKDYRIPVYI